MDAEGEARKEMVCEDWREGDVVRKEGGRPTMGWAEMQGQPDAKLDAGTATWQRERGAS